MKRSLALILSALMGAVLLTSGASAAAAAPTAAPTAAPYCGITWGSLPKSLGVTAPDATITNARAGQHSCFDRFVVDVRGDLTGYAVQYGVVRKEGSGTPVPLRGAADLRVIALSDPFDNNNVVTYDPANDNEAVNVSGYRTFRQVAFAGGFGGESTFGLGVRARLPFRTFILDGPGDGSRLVVDVAHQW